MSIKEFGETFSPTTYQIVCPDYSQKAGEQVLLLLQGMDGFVQAENPQLIIAIDIRPAELPALLDKASNVFLVMAQTRDVRGQKLYQKECRQKAKDRWPKVTLLTAQQEIIDFGQPGWEKKIEDSFWNLYRELLLIQ